MSENISESLYFQSPELPAHLKALYLLLGGRPVIIPIPPAWDKDTKRVGPTKGPRYEHWRQLTFADTRDPEKLVEYWRDNEATKAREFVRSVNLRGLLYDSRNNFGVVQGASSELVEAGVTYRLCSIDIDDNDGVGVFAAANPKLAETLQTVGQRGRNYWVWVAGEIPPLHKDLCWKAEAGGADKARPFGEWRSTGGQTVIYGTHPKTGKPYRRDVEKPPVRIQFSDIVWPEGLYLPWAEAAKRAAAEAEALAKKEAAEKDIAEVKALVEKYGKAFDISKKGRITMNQTFWAAYYKARHEVVFAPEEERFFRYAGPDTGLWLKQTTASVRQELAREILAFGVANSTPELAFQCTTALESSIAAKIQGFAEEWAAFTRPISKKTGRARCLVHLQNCMLDLDASPPEELPFGPQHRSRNQLQMKLDVEAECPVFIEELLRGALHPEDLVLLQKVAGQILLGVNLGQKICILTGEGGRGKSTFVKLLQRLIGEENCGELRTKHLAERFEIFSMIGKSLLVGNDVKGDFMMVDGAEVLKSLVGGDLKAAEAKQGNDRYQVRGEFNVLITCNTRLRQKLDGDAEAWRRRLILIEFAGPKPKKKDPRFVEKILAKEASGVLNWMILGAVMLLTDIEETGDIRMTKRQIDRIESLLAESDSVRDFVRRGCEKAPKTEVVTTEDMKAAYIAYCDARKWAPLPSAVVEKQLPDALETTHGAFKSNDIKKYPQDSAKRGYRGVRLVVGAGEIAEAESAAASGSHEGDAQGGGDTAANEATAGEGSDARTSESESGVVGARSALDKGPEAPPPPSSPSTAGDAGVREAGGGEDQGRAGGGIENGYAQDDDPYA